MKEHRFTRPGNYSSGEWLRWHQAGDCRAHERGGAGECPFHDEPDRGAVADLRGAEPKLPPMRGPRDPENLDLFGAL